tara:strand:- start:1026 stop:1286 length:261 start_codon:yes stop_codon:yes gene_type:complete
LLYPLLICLNAADFGPVCQRLFVYSAAVSSTVAAVSAAVSSSLSSQALSAITAKIGKINFIISPLMKILKSGRLLTGLPAALFTTL